MNKGPIRRAQLISPFGVGAMVVVRGGTTLLTCGLDNWYNSYDHQVEVEEFEISEWRLQQVLKVDHFRLPPDYRRWERGRSKLPNLEISVPSLRFPRWHYCPKCGMMQELSPTVGKKEKCKNCEAKNITRYLVQVPFVAICDHGHLQDFPWKEWVHQSADTTCDQQMYFTITGGSSLEGISVYCECNKDKTKRSLDSITIAYSEEKTFLSEKLDKGGKPYLCKGSRPWLGDFSEEGCARPLRGAINTASNVYFPCIASSIYIPEGGKLATILQEESVSKDIQRLVRQKNKYPNINLVEELRDEFNEKLKQYHDDEIEETLNNYLKGKTNDDTVSEDNSETAFRRQEFNVLRRPRTEEDLLIRQADLNKYSSKISQYFSRICLVDKLKETRALAGFNRVFSNNSQSLEERKKLMWKSPPDHHNMWLPAYVVYGEGIFIEFNEEKLQTWLGQNRLAIEQRLSRMIKRYDDLQEKRHLRERPLGARFILLHTFAHLMINRLTYDCGYSSAALRERLYVSDNPQVPMAAILIYTAAGDSEGTLGGLVRMGKPGYFEQVVMGALEAALWCSADPVCMEIGKHGGQGPESCNLAACHNCALVPETACEEFNMFLDRGLVIGDFENRSLGYFSDI